MRVFNVVVLACVLRATTKKVVNFFGEKIAPQRKSRLRLCFELLFETLATTLGKLYFCYEITTQNSDHSFFALEMCMGMGKTVIPWDLGFGNC